MIVGVDFDTHQVQLALLSETYLVFERADFGKGDLNPRLARIEPLVRAFSLPRLIVDSVVIESPSGRFGHPYSIWQAFGVLKSAFAGLGLRVEEIEPNDWRGAIGAEHRGSKESGHATVRELIEEIRPDWEDLDEHQLDAAGVALAGRVMLCREATA